MKKQLASALAVLAVASVGTAFAANPFSDVTPNDWAYQAVSSLASEGIVNGFPNGTFQGQKDMTRYEMAQIVAKALAYQGKITAEQQATINKLAAQFGDELKTLGVKVDGLNDKIGNVKLTGDVRVRYKGKDDQAKNTTVSTFDYRARVNLAAAINDSTKAQVRLTTGGTEFGTGNDAVKKLTFDRLNVAHQFGDVAVVLGRQSLVVGEGLSFDGTFDGAVAAANLGGVNVAAGHGYLVSGLTEGLDAKANHEVTLVEASGSVAPAKVGGFYAKLNNEVGALKDFYGANLAFDLGGNTKLAGEWLKSNVEKSSAWVASLSNGNYNMAKPGTYALTVSYARANEAAPVLDTTYHQPLNIQKTNGNGYKGWNVQGQYALAKNVGLKAWYNFDGKTVKDNKEVKNNWDVELNYKF